MITIIIILSHDYDKIVILSQPLSYVLFRKLFVNACTKDYNWTVMQMLPILWCMISALIYLMIFRCKADFDYYCLNQIWAKF